TRALPLIADRRAGIVGIAGDGARRHQLLPLLERRPAGERYRHRQAGIVDHRGGRSAGRRRRLGGVGVARGGDDADLRSLVGLLHHVGRAVGADWGEVAGAEASVVGTLPLVVDGRVAVVGRGARGERGAFLRKPTDQHVL